MEKRSDWKEIGLAHFAAIFSGLDPSEVSGRCKLPFENGVFTIRLMGTEYRVSHPDFSLMSAEAADGLPCENEPPGNAEKMLILRYLCEGRWQSPSGGRISYREVPWGETYFANFEGRCIKRLARAFGEAPELFCAVFENIPALRALKLPGKTAYRFEFVSELFFTFILWPGDSEFPSQAQILFDDNIPAAFSAEDLAAAGDISISRLIKYAEQFRRVN